MSDPNTHTKQRQRVLVGVAITGILVLIGAGMFLFDSGPTQRRERPKTVRITAPGTLDDKDAWRAQQAAREKSNETLISEMKSQIKLQEAQSKQLVKALEELKSNKKTEGFVPEGSVLSPSLPVSAGMSKVEMLNPPMGQVDNPVPREVEMITFDGASTVSESRLDAASNASAPKSSQQAIEFLPAGSFVRVTMLNGVDAPTGGQAQSNPLPVAFHVLDVANLANQHQLDIKDCRIIAAAWGDLSSERMMGRTETLACMINGQAVEMAIKGQVIGEDGKAGVRGRLVTKQGQLLANALFSGALSGIGQVFQSSAAITSVGGGGVTQVMDPKKMGSAIIGGGMSSASHQLAQYYLKAADKLYPVIETDGGRTVEILITKGAVYNGKSLAKDDYQALLNRAGVHSRRVSHD